MGFLDLLGKGFKTITGIQAYQDRKAANRMKETAESIKNYINDKNESLKNEANEALEYLGHVRLNTLKNTIGPFLNYIDLIGLQTTSKEYQITGDISISRQEIQELGTIEMNASEALKATGIAGSIATVALTGVPSAVTWAVGQFAAASTGIAIKSLSGAAATKATLAWLGGGAVSAGGGGVAVGTTVLSGITYASAGIFALASAGLIAGMHYSKKKTEAYQYLADVQKWAKEAEVGFTLIEGIIAKANEMADLTERLGEKAIEQLSYLDPLIPDFSANDKICVTSFQICRMLIKAISEISQVPLLDESTGELSQASGIAVNNVKTIVNKEL